MNCYERFICIFPKRKKKNLVIASNVVNLKQKKSFNFSGIKLKKRAKAT